MKGIRAAAAFSLLTISVVPQPLAAKGRTLKITVHGGGLAAPIEITDPNVGQFAVWDGLGTFRNGVEATEGFIIEWRKGIAAERPGGLETYQVSFYTGCQRGEWDCRMSEPTLSYVVLYAYDPALEQGYVYLPGKTDLLFQFNTRMWHGHGFEGNWSFATKAWQDFVRPLIARAKARGSNQ